ncbi:MAG: M28 family peptidase [Pirellulales bacterium]|nr:M28 family peptidase [Pirellulales bacterium]
MSNSSARKTPPTLTSPQGAGLRDHRLLIVLAAVLLLAGLGTALYAYFSGESSTDNAQRFAIDFDGEQTYKYLKEICDIGPRRSGSEGMKKQQKYITDYFKGIGLEVIRQEFTDRHPLTGEPVEFANLIVELHPEKKDRVLLCCHYDTRPFPDEDLRNPQGTFIGANDGASGVALLMQMAVELKNIDTAYGVDLIMFDGEELIFRPSIDRYFLGSEYFASVYAKTPPKHKYHYGILLDMIGDAELQIYQERNSLAYQETAPLVNSIWRTARSLRVLEFINKPKYEIRDDHLALNNTAKIPTCDLIDFDYIYWHTEGDVPSRCSAESLAKVGYVLKVWLQRAAPGQRLPGI